MYQCLYFRCEHDCASFQYIYCIQITNSRSGSTTTSRPSDKPGALKALDPVGRGYILVLIRMDTCIGIWMPWLTCCVKMQVPIPSWRARDRRWLSRQLCTRSTRSILGSSTAHVINKRFDRQSKVCVQSTRTVLMGLLIDYKKAILFKIYCFHFVTNPLASIKVQCNMKKT